MCIRDRDKMFFVINGVTLTGQQSGTVTLRLRLTTFLREGGSQEPPPGAELVSAERSATTPSGGAR